MTYYNKVFIRLTTSQDMVGPDVLARFFMDISISESLSFKILGLIFQDQKTNEINVRFPRVQTFGDTPYPAFNPNKELYDRITKIIRKYWDYLHNDYGKKLQYSVAYECKIKSEDKSIVVIENRRK